MDRSIDGSIHRSSSKQSIQPSTVNNQPVGGDNTYKLRRLGKERLRREGRLPISIACNPANIAKGRELIQAAAAAAAA
eukprot:CAMPEP_0172364610 /NCGR_PEP_ID=MMETSP1060-20121228/7691_1 /TAXON_ID=37318 /ORGANISM="Pseudo-nitzschia pungens, Strain cf. cingulata" /LENGTH=77 /DNA_ID=CAMNT_0013087645 /DNA_START=1 /DNA_END=230 /DNA_ORIENTATION=-